MVIYKITNIINDKVYVGQTINTIHYRWLGHIHDMKRNRNYPLYNSMRKYGVENFTLEQIDTAINQQELDEKEVYWGLKLNAIKPTGYSLRLGKGKGVVSESTRKKLSENVKLRCKDPKYIENLRQHQLGKKASEDTKLKISKAGKGRKCSEATKIKMRKPKSEETRLKMCKPKSLETIAKFRKPKSEDARKHMCGHGNFKGHSHSIDTKIRELYI